MFKKTKNQEAEHTPSSLKRMAYTEIFGMKYI